MEQHVLVVLPHPDDETFGCGGTIALFSQAGVPVTYICGTLGQMGRNMGKPFFATRESLPKVREAELEEACKAIGIQHLIKLGLRDKTIEFEDPEPLIERIEQIVREIRPSLVLTHYPGFSVHPDHNALGDLTIRALSRLSPQERPTVYAHAFARDCQKVIGAPDIINDISPVAEVKLAAIRAHKSQSQLIIAANAQGQTGSKPTAKNQFRSQFSHMLMRESFWTYRFS
ncbi:bacillithiol biosynthesis deacetylase BshB2 [Desulfosporosinus sp. PR]|uniref:bacillithiol biosynthesis deacetylase BshB2 n=1 Tax=Candidatus Desulfosporosinus nitrosoreducens TaxID=3401928 RepID=UPI0027F2D4A6|nr:bacillithiol biosynthesis deacetylase BshB2 [Desulfosporosinus sp. PR]MDQ7095368.1 bacillithiol biosynthesis deacetylase BshB2 [Desulfosporosinus sp. PR]